MSTCLQPEAEEGIAGQAPAHSMRDMSALVSDVHSHRISFLGLWRQK